MTVRSVAVGGRKPLVERAAVCELGTCGRNCGGTWRVLSSTRVASEGQPRGQPPGLLTAYLTSAGEPVIQSALLSSVQRDNLTEIYYSYIEHIKRIK